MKTIYVTVALLIVAVCLFSLVTGLMDKSLTTDQIVIFLILIFVFLISAYVRTKQGQTVTPTSGSAQASASDDEGPSVLVHFKLSSDMGEEAEREKLLELEESLENLVDKTGAGHLDGNEFGGGEFVLFFYGKDADILFQTLEPALRSSPLSRGAFAVKRYGDGEDAKEVTIRI